MSGKRKRRPVGETIGGVIFGFDQQIFRSTKPPAELVESARPIPPIPSAGGGTLDIDLPAVGPTPSPRRPSAKPDPSEAG